MAETNNQPQNASPRWVRVALVLSLGLNLAVLGIVIGAVMSGMGPRAHSAMVRDLGFGAFTDALAPEDRSAMRAAFLGQPREIYLSRREMRAEFEELLSLLRAEPFDQVALTEALTRQNARSRARLVLGQNLLTERIAVMTPEARRGFADRLEASLARRKGGHLPGDGPPGN